MTASLKNLLKDEVMNIREHLQDKKVELNDNVLFECGTIGDVTCHYWCKDGEVLSENDRITMTSSRTWHMLNINAAQVSDTGVYQFVAFSDESVTYTHATLFVGPPNGTGVIYYTPSPNRQLKIESTMLPTRVVVGEEMRLLMKVNAPLFRFKYTWSKSNRQIVECNRIKLRHNFKTVALIIRKAIRTDSGIYYLLVYTKNEVISAVTQVIVVDPHQLSYFDSRGTPSIVKELPEEVEFSEGERRLLVCKANIDQETKIIWMQNESRRFSSNRLRTACTYDGTLALSFLDPSTSDAGSYSLTLRSRQTDKSVTSKCSVSVTERQASRYRRDACRRPKVEFHQPLQSVIAAVGSRVAFCCGVQLSQSKDYFAVWYIGSKRVESTNNQFGVISKNGTYLLTIKYVQANMNGDIIFNLRCTTTPRSSIVVARTSASITVVPNYIVDSRLLHLDVEIKETARKLFVLKTNQKAGINENDYLFQDLSQQGSGGADVLQMQYIYSRLHEVGHYFMEVENYGTEKRYPRAFVDEENSHSNNDDEKVIYFEWDPSPAVKAYNVSMLDKDGQFCEVSTVTRPRFTLRHSQLEKIYIFHISAAELRPGDSLDLSIVPVEPKNLPPRPVLPEDNHKNKITDDILKCPFQIGQGKFGKVVLLHDEEGEKIACKVSVTDTPKKRIMPRREFNILQSLNHPNIVRLFDSISTTTSFCMMMEYLWGGNLLERVREQKICEYDAIFYAKQIAAGISYLHSLNIVHLDLKLDNIVFLNPNSRHGKIIDFGFARVLGEKDCGGVTVFGTTGFISPEMLKDYHMSTACDMWSFGVIVYAMLSRCMPFAGRSLLEAAKAGTSSPHSYKYHFDGVSLLAREFIDQLFVMDYETRMTAVKALEHAWLVRGPPAGYLDTLATERVNRLHFMLTCKPRWQHAARMVRMLCLFSIQPSPQFLEELIGVDESSTDTSTPEGGGCCPCFKVKTN